MANLKIPDPFEKLAGITVEGQGLEEYFRDQYSSDAADEANETTQRLTQITYTKPPKYRHRGRTKTPEALPVKTYTKEEIMDEHYQKIYEQYTTQAESWIGNYLRQDAINKGVLSIGMLQLGFRTCKEIAGKAYDICQTYSGNSSLLTNYHASAISSRLSTWMLKPANGSYLHAFIETKPLEKEEQVGGSPGFKYRLWPPLLQISPSDLICLSRNPGFGKGQPFTLTDLMNKIPQASEYLDTKIPASEQRQALRRKIIAAKKKPVRIRVEGSPDPEPETTEEKELTATETVDGPIVETIDETAAETIDSIPDIALIDKLKLNPTETNDATRKALQEILSGYLTPSTAGKSTLDININVNFSFGRRD